MTKLRGVERNKQTEARCIVESPIGFLDRQNSRESAPFESPTLYIRLLRNEVRNAGRNTPRCSYAINIEPALCRERLGQRAIYGASSMLLGLSVLSHRNMVSLSAQRLAVSPTERYTRGVPLTIL